MQRTALCYPCTGSCSTNNRKSCCCEASAVEKRSRAAMFTKTAFVGLMAPKGALQPCSKTCQSLVSLGNQCLKVSLQTKSQPFLPDF